MSIEQEYYEIDYFWSGILNNENDLARIREITDLIPDEVQSLLDVGCGDGLFANHLLDSGRKFSRLHAVDRSHAALKHVRAEKSQASIDELLFEPRSFDLVSCLEVIEHLPVRTYEAGLDNLCRIAREFVILSVPYQEDVERTMLLCPSCRTHFNPDYHMRGFDDPTIKGLLAGRGFAVRRIIYLNPQTRYRFLWKFLHPHPPIEQRTNPAPVGLPCPVCGFHLPPNPTCESLNSPENRSRPSVLRQWVKSLWPKETGYKWIVALYQRQS